jgi:Zn-dependent protease
LPTVYPSAPLLGRVVAAVIGAILFFASILGHELGHALVARRHDVGVEGITLWVLGGVAKLTRQAPTPRAEFQIAIAGPLASLAIGLIFAGSAIGLSQRIDGVLAPAVLAWLAAVNLLLAVSNLLPGAPLDGGRVLTAVLWKRVGNAERARLLSARCGFVLGILLMALGLVQATQFDQPTAWWTVLVGAFILTAARSEIAGAAIRHRLSVALAGQWMCQHPTPVADSLTVDQALGIGRSWAVPVVRWGTEPVGYITDSLAANLEPAARSWTPVVNVMASVEDVPRGWANETLETIIERADGAIDHVTVIHEPRDGSAVGTLTRAQLDPLFAPPDFWGRTRDQAPPPPSDAGLVFGSARHQ